MFWKILMELFPFLRECFFGKKLPPTEEADKEKEKPNTITRIFSGLINAFLNSRRVAIAVLLFLFFSVFINYHLGQRIYAITREETTKESSSNSPVATKPKDDYDYYNHLIDHLRNTYDQ